MTPEEVARSARARQAEELSKFRHSEELAAETTKLYDAVDALQPIQKRLLVRNLLVVTSSLAVQAVRHPELIPSVRMGIGLLGYINELDRAFAGETLTEDVALIPAQEALDSIHHLLILEQMRPDEETEALALREEVNRREAAGEDVNSIAEDIASRLYAQQQHPSNGSSDAPTGLYL